MTADMNNQDDIGNPRDIGAFYMNRPQAAAPAPERRRFSPGLVSVAILAFFGGVIWYAYPHGQDRYEGTDVPVIRADAAPFKSQPVEPGGMMVPHQDSTVFAPLEGAAAPTASEQPVPATEDPMPREEEHIVPTGPDGDIDQRDAAAEPAEETASAPGTPEVLASAPPVEEEKTAEPVTPVAEKQAAPAETPKKVAAAPAPKTAEKAATPAPAKAAEAVAPASGRTVFVQLGSFKDESAANKAWSQFKKQFGGILGSLAPRIEKADLGAKGTFWRLQAGAVSEPEGARICTELKAKGFTTCILAKR